jgi:hypothetical protein
MERKAERRISYICILYRMAITEFWFGNTKSLKGRRLFFNYVVYLFIHIEWFMILEIVKLCLSFVEIYKLSVKNEIVDDKLRLQQIVCLYINLNY